MYEGILHNVTRIPTGQAAFLQALAGAADRWSNLAWQKQQQDEQRRRWEAQMALEQARYRDEMALRQMQVEEQAKAREAERAMKERAFALDQAQLLGGAVPNPEYYDYRSAQEALAGPLGVPEEGTPDAFAPQANVFVPGSLWTSYQERLARARELENQGEAAIKRAEAYSQKVEAAKTKPAGAAGPKAPPQPSEKDFLNYYSLLQHAQQQGAISGPLPPYEEFKANFQQWAPVVSQAMPKRVGVATDKDIDRALKASVVASVDNVTYYRLPDGSVTDDPEVARASILKKMQEQGIAYQSGVNASPSAAYAPQQPAPSQPVGAPPQLGGRRNSSGRADLGAFFR